MKEIFADQPGGPKPLVDQPAANAVPIQSVPGSIPSPAPPAAATAPRFNEFEQAATAGLIEIGVRFPESLAAVTQNAPAGEPLSNRVSLDPRTNRPVLSIPLPKSVDQNRLVRALSGALGALNPTDQAAGDNLCRMARLWFRSHGPRFPNHRRANGRLGLDRFHFAG